MNRRKFLLTASVAAMVTATTRIAFADEKTIHVFSGSDSNIIDFWNNIVAPAFEKTYPGITIKVIDAGDNNGLVSIAERALAAMKTHTNPQVEIFESFFPQLPSGALKAGLWVDFKKAHIKNFDHINPEALEGNYAAPYHGSQVLLAYDKTKLDPKDAPKTWGQLTKWIKANPGQFIYNRPDKGGSGGNFVHRAIHQANGLDPSIFKIDNYSKAFAAKTLPGAWKLLNDIAPFLYGKGAYTSGNTQSIQLLGQSVVTMVPVWSDQVLQAISQGVLPKTTGLVQLTDLALCGNFARITIPTNAVAKDAALKLVGFLLSQKMQDAILTELGGFPGIKWDYISADLRQKYADVVPKSIPTFPSGEWDIAINNGWYRNVAPNIKRG